MGDAIEYCTGCETNQMCHMERKCMGREIAGDCKEFKGSGGVCGEPCPDCDGVGWLESDITSKNRHCSASSVSLRSKRDKIEARLSARMRLIGRFKWPHDTQCKRMTTQIQNIDFKIWQAENSKD